MMKKAILVVSILAFALSACSSPAPATPTIPEAAAATPQPTLPATQPATPTAQPLIMLASRMQSEDHSDQRYTVDLEIPVLSGPEDVVNTFNQVVSRYFDQTLSEFQENAEDAAKAWVKGMPDTNSFISSEIHLISMSDRLVSVSVSIHEYMVAAAHPNTFSVSFNYDLSTGKMLALSDLFQPGADYLTLLSQTSLADLKKNPDLAIFEEGTTPQEENFVRWNIATDGLRLTFDPYQVAPYAAGTQIVTIPYETLQTILSPLGQQLLARGS